MLQKALRKRHFCLFSKIHKKTLASLDARVNLNGFS